MQVCEPLSNGSSTSVRNVFRFRFQKKVESSAKKKQKVKPRLPRQRVPSSTKSSPCPCWGVAQGPFGPRYDLLRRILEAPEPDYCSEISLICPRKGVSPPSSGDSTSPTSSPLSGDEVGDVESTFGFLPSLPPHVDHFVGILLFMDDVCLNSSA
jgi:hypothetical protein